MHKYNAIGCWLPPVWCRLCKAQPTFQWSVLEPLRFSSNHKPALVSWVLPKCLFDDKKWKFLKTQSKSVPTKSPSLKQPWNYFKKNGQQFESQFTSVKPGSPGEYSCCSVPCRRRRCCALCSARCTGSWCTALLLLCKSSPAMRLLLWLRPLHRLLVSCPPAAATI